MRGSLARAPPAVTRFSGALPRPAGRRRLLPPERPEVPVVLLVLLAVPLLLLAGAALWDRRAAARGRHVRQLPDDLDAAIRTAKRTAAVTAGIVLLDLSDGG